MLIIHNLFLGSPARSGLQINPSFQLLSLQSSSGFKLKYQENGESQYIDRREKCGLSLHFYDKVVPINQFKQDQ